MRGSLKILFCLAAFITVALPAGAVSVLRSERRMANQWTEQHLVKLDPAPFSFTYGGRPSAELLKTWKTAVTKTALDANRTHITITSADPAGGLAVRCEATQYRDFPAVEWTLWFENKGQADTALLENPRFLNCSVARKSPSEFQVHYAEGSQNNPTDFAPRMERLGPGSTFRLFSNGMSSIDRLPYFNLEADGGGIIGGLGWSGSWQVNFTRSGDRMVALEGGNLDARFVLHPGEHIRTPRMMLLFWHHDRIRAHNLWRRLLLTYNVPRENGKPIQAPICGQSWGEQRDVDQIERIHWWADNGLKIDMFWIDAGWSGRKGHPWMTEAANRVPNAEYYPHGLRPVADAAHKRGFKFLLWVWPHYAVPGVEVGAEHPEWVMPDRGAGTGLDHANPVVNQWMIERYTKLIKDFGMDCMRQDGHACYVYPDPEPNRLGVHQYQYFEGFYAFWDGLRARCPGLMIDNCSGGGRKLDLETMCRSLPLWRSDFQVPMDFDPRGMQNQTYGLSFWLPLSGGVTTSEKTYPFRSGYSPALSVYVTDGPGFKQKINVPQLRKMLDEYRSLREIFYGDYYPLTPYQPAADQWIAWQFDRPETGEGIVQAFRRAQCGQTELTLKLQGLKRFAKYTVTNLDENKPAIVRGGKLMKEGLTIRIAEQPGAALITYKKVD